MVLEFFSRPNVKTVFFVPRAKKNGLANSRQTYHFKTLHETILPSLIVIVDSQNVFQKLNSEVKIAFSAFGTKTQLYAYIEVKTQLLMHEVKLKLNELIMDRWLSFSLEDQSILPHSTFIFTAYFRKKQYIIPWNTRMMSNYIQFMSQLKCFYIEQNNYVITNR